VSPAARSPAAPAAAVAARLAQLAGAYRQFTLAAGNGLVPRPLALAGRDLRALALLPPGRAAPVLNTRELAGLWHLPQAGADTPLVERTAARQRLPLPGTVAAGCPVGAAAHQGRRIPVALPDDLLGRHLLLVAKTRRGKSALMLRLARHLMARERAVVLLDPHRDLARAALGLVPPARHGDVVFLDVGNGERPFGLNLLDTGLGWTRDQAVESALMLFRRQFDQAWGLRMEDAFRAGLTALYQANEALCAAEPRRGRDRQHTVLELPDLYNDLAFRTSILAHLSDEVARKWWTGYFGSLDRRFQLEISNPVQTKVNRFAGSWAARAVVGQPRSTIDPRAWLERGAIVIVDGAQGVVGEDTAALVGGTLFNLVKLAVGAQAALPEGRRRAVSVLVDEFHTMPGADYELVLSELGKYGIGLVLATQSLARLDTLDRAHERALRATVFACLDGLFAFHTSAEDARYLVPELGGEAEVDVADLTALGEHRCYARISAGGERLPPFLVRLDPPPASDPAVAGALAEASAGAWGRERAAVEADLASAQARIRLTHRFRQRGRKRGKAHDLGHQGTGREGDNARRDQPRPRGRPPGDERQGPRQGLLFGDGEVHGLGADDDKGATC
jgi:hypothetical protein